MLLRWCWLLLATIELEMTKLVVVITAKFSVVADGFPFVAWLDCGAALLFVLAEGRCC